ncbi:MAG: LPS-assembly protein LptD [Burkholderiales bacterium]|nr:LPS-assembly protein LptD [Burkholderiales bacterium]
MAQRSNPIRNGGRARTRPAVLARIVAALVLALGLCRGATAEGQGLQLHRTPLGPAPQSGEDVPAFVIADRIEGVAGVEVEAVGNAELHRGATTLFADRIRYVSEFDEAEAVGHVRIRLGEDELTGPRLRLRVTDNAGVIDEPTYAIVPREHGITGRAAAPTGARGSAKAARFDGRDSLRVTDGTFTTCKPGQDDWYISAGELDLDLDREVGTARQARLTFLGMTTPALPALDFPLNNRRKSGFLAPTFAMSNSRGWEVVAPYYWNIAPNYDATIAPRYMRRRGLQLLTQFRYLLPTSVGEARMEILPDDKATNESRWGVSLRDTSVFPGGWSSNINYSRVSDDQYFRDLSGRLAVATQLFLPQEGSVSYGGGWWSSTLRLQRYQTLQDPLNPVTTPYARLPQLTLTALRSTRAGFDVGAGAEVVAFDHSTLVQGERSTVYPYLAWPLMKSYGFVRPKIGVSATYYNLRNADPLTPTSQSRVLPIASVDSGLYFERDVQWFNRDFLQTLEPRAYYLRVPYRDQSQIPLFDTAIADLSYAQLFSENYYVGGDRISDANQLTIAAVSRLLRPASGEEAVRAFVGQRYYFADQRVGLNSSTPTRTANTAPIIGGLSGQIAPHWRAEAAAQYSWSGAEFDRFNIGARYSPQFAKVVTAAYRYARQTTAQPEIRQIDVAAQWPLWRGLYGLARVNYDFFGRQLVESLAGIEYNADCWIVRAVVQSFVSSSEKRTYQFFVQLELNGLARIGTDPLEALRRNIPGYMPTNAPSTTTSTDVFPGRGETTGPFGQY